VRVSEIDAWWSIVGPSDTQGHSTTCLLKTESSCKAKSGTAPTTVWFTCQSATLGFSSAKSASVLSNCYWDTSATMSLTSARHSYSKAELTSCLIETSTRVPSIICSVTGCRSQTSCTTRWSSYVCKSVIWSRRLITARSKPILSTRRFNWCRYSAWWRTTIKALPSSKHWLNRWKAWNKIKLSRSWQCLCICCTKTSRFNWLLTYWSRFFTSSPNATS
jgi:hypothetical protein